MMLLQYFFLSFFSFFFIHISIGFTSMVYFFFTIRDCVARVIQSICFLLCFVFQSDIARFNHKSDNIFFMRIIFVSPSSGLGSCIAAELSNMIYLSFFNLCFFFHVLFEEQHTRNIIEKRQNNLEQKKKNKVAMVGVVR